MAQLRLIPASLLAGLLWWLHWLPLPVLAPLGRRLGDALYYFGKQRRRIARINLERCFPELTADARQALLREHFRLLGRSLIERSLFWWAPPERLSHLIQVEGEKKIQALQTAGQPVILLAPHFLGLDAGGVAITMRFNIVSIYAEQSNPVFNRLLLRGRQRFGDQKLLSRQDGALATVKAMRSGRPFYYLPDMNARRRDAAFIPFFGMQAATVTGLPRLAKAAGAQVLSCTTRILPDGKGYQVVIGDPWQDYPSGDLTTDLTRMNQWIESAIRDMPEQYYWVHRRFKTRPLGETRFY